jgi:PAS domain S-box-containing protein
MFDWRELRRWGIDEARLPPGSIVRFREFSVWELYKWRIIGAISIIVLQALGIVWLLFTRTKRRQAEEAKNNLAAIVETSDDAILSNTLEGIIISWNAGAQKIYGYFANEIVGQHVSTLAPPDLKGEVRGILERLSRGESVDHLETQRVSKEGMRIDVSLTVSPIRNERGIIIGASTIARDITARKKAEVEGLQHREELAHLSRVTMLGELSGSLAHELNQPLTAILSNAQAAKRFLEHDDVDLDEVRDILTDIVDQNKRAGEVIHRLRLLLKKGEVDQQPLDANNTVQEVLKLIHGDLVNHSVTMHTKFAPALPTVKGDRVQLQQVLLNLVMNASEAMNSNSATDRQMIVCTELSNGEGVRFSVSDCGSGIAPDEFEQVFKPFFTTKPHGLGLGLSVCRTIISAHGGKLWAANNPERGVTFHFTVPVSNGVSG